MKKTLTASFKFNSTIDILSAYSFQLCAFACFAVLLCVFIFALNACLPVMFSLLCQLKLSFKFMRHTMLSIPTRLPFPVSRLFQWDVTGAVHTVRSKSMKDKAPAHTIQTCPILHEECFFFTNCGMCVLSMGRVCCECEPNISLSTSLKMPKRSTSFFQMFQLLQFEN